MRCFNCKKATNSSDINGITAKPGRGETCASCGADVKVCLNCRFFEPGSYNECREGTAERVLVKDRSNFCDHFEASFEASGEDKSTNDRADRKEPPDPMDKLKDLFGGS